MEGSFGATRRPGIDRQVIHRLGLRDQRPLASRLADAEAASIWLRPPGGGMAGGGHFYRCTSRASASSRPNGPAPAARTRGRRRSPWTARGRASGRPCGSAACRRPPTPSRFPVELATAAPGHGVPRRRAYLGRGILSRKHESTKAFGLRREDVTSRTGTLRASAIPGRPCAAAAAAARGRSVSSRDPSRDR